MSTTFSSDTQLTIPEQLRLTAEQLIKDNSTQASLRSPLSPDVLAFLYQVASSPKGSSDALKLLHEFQVHQVELDLQFNQFESNELALTKTLNYYQALFNSAPLAYLLTSIDGQILDGNKGAANLLGIEQSELSHYSINNLLKSEDKSRLTLQLNALKPGATSVHFELAIDCQQRGICRLLITANLGVDGESVQMILFKPTLSLLN